MVDEIATVNVEPITPKPEETTTLVSAHEADKDIVVFAQDSVGVRMMQQPLIEWMTLKVNDEEKELADLEENLAIAKKNKLATKPWQGRVSRQKRKVEYYKKGKLALEAGYWMVPAFPADTFAVRTTKSKPEPTVHSWASSAPDVKSTNPPAGEGTYVDSRPLVEQFTRRTWDKEKQDWKEETKFRPSELDTTPDFPISFAKPQVLDATGRAMALKIFDEIGILPYRTQRRGDPMVIGKIFRKEGYTTHELNFVICWWIDTRQL